MNTWTERRRQPCFAPWAIVIPILAVGCAPKDDGTTKARIASLESKDWQSRVDKVDVLAEAQSLQTLALIRLALRDSHPRVREAAVKALVRRKAQTSVPDFVEAVKDPDEGVRVAAVEALQQFTGEQAVSLVLLRLGSGSEREREAARAGLAAQLRRSAPPVRQAALGRLVIMVKAERPDAQGDAIKVLAQVGPDAVEPLLDALAAARPGSEGQWMERIETLLGRMGRAAVQPLVAALLQASEKEARASRAARVLVRIGAESVPALLQTLDGSKQQSLEAAELAEEALVSIGQAAAPAVAALLSDPADHRRLAAVELLQRLRSPAAVPALLALLEKESSRVIRLAVVRALGNAGDQQAVAPVLAALRKDSLGRGRLDAQQWSAYSEALAALRAPAKDLVPALGDPRPQVRLVAAQVAARLRLGEAARALPALLKDKEVDVLGAAATAAGDLGVQGAAPAL
ncbi:MAG: HEAT repeat domain-containing protein, partial [Polyangia bacterium]|nr:HEAT repeat domain-containing protein [Polyangia bacterium]